MQASTAKNETRLPRAVLRRSAELRERFENRDATETDPAATNTELPEGAPPVEATKPEETPIAAAPAAPVDPRENDLEYWKQKAKSAAGRLTKVAEENRAQVEGLQGAIVELQEQIRSLQASQPAPAIDLTAYFTPEQIDQFGEDQCTMMLAGAEKRTRELLQSTIDAEIKPLREQRQQEQQRAAADKKQEFLDALEDAFPGYEAIDNRDDWKAWLAEEDPDAGIDRGEILNRHIQRFDAAKVAAMFTKFVQATRREPPVVPRGTGAGAGNEPPPPRAAAMKGHPTAKEIRDFYTRSALNKVTAAERVEFEERLKLSPVR